MRARNAVPRVAANGFAGSELAGEGLNAAQIGRTLLAFSLPVLGSTVLQSVSGSINTIWIGHFLGAAAQAATASANGILSVLLSVAFGVAIAASILISHAVGARDVERAKRVIGSSVTFFAAFSVLVSIAGECFAEHLLTWIHTPADSIPAATRYLRIMFVAVPPMFAYQFIMMALRGGGDSMTPLRFMILSVVLNIVLDPLLIFGLGGAPRMGVAGAAVVTLIVQIVSLAGLLRSLHRRAHPIMLRREELHLLYPDPQVMRDLLFRGSPLGLQMIVMAASMLALFTFVNEYGSATAAAFSATMQIFTYVQMPAFAVGSAVSAMTAQNLGARRVERLEKILRSGILLSTTLIGAAVLVLYAAGEYILRLFLPADPATLAIALQIDRACLWSLPLLGVTFAAFGVCRATGAVYGPLLILFVSLFLARLAVAYLLSPLLHASAIWWSVAAGNVTLLALAAAYYRLGSWKKARLGGVRSLEA